MSTHPAPPDTLLLNVDNANRNTLCTRDVAAVQSQVSQRIQVGKYIQGRDGSFKPRIITAAPGNKQRANFGVEVASGKWDLSSEGKRGFGTREASVGLLSISMRFGVRKSTGRGWNSGTILRNLIVPEMCVTWKIWEDREPGLQVNIPRFFANGQVAAWLSSAVHGIKLAIEGIGPLHFNDLRVGQSFFPDRQLELERKFAEFGKGLRSRVVR
ncbi:hypothetical protein DL95DRAFT_415080 [Leptodontidium sp. 2 PMI_412]|nr:hypothetical protein DL95DRAFT_415080 [Leptodontidium sp. 2 PMI_412]